MIGFDEWMAQQGDTEDDEDLPWWIERTNQGKLVAQCRSCKRWYDLDWEPPEDYDYSVCMGSDRCVL